jgi:hypothetical protein
MRLQDFFFNIHISSSRTMTLRLTASNRNEYHESSWKVKRGRRVRLTTLPSLWAYCLENVGFFYVSQTYRPLRPVRCIASHFLLYFSEFLTEDFQNISLGRYWHRPFQWDDEWFIPNLADVKRYCQSASIHTYECAFLVELSLSYGRRPVDQFVLVSGSPLGPITRFFPFLSLVTIVLFFL